MARQVYRQGEEDGSKLTNYALLCICLCLCLSLSEEMRKMKGKRGRRGSKGKKKDGRHFKQGILFPSLINSFTCYNYAMQDSINPWHKNIQFNSCPLVNAEPNCMSVKSYLGVKLGRTICWL